MRLHGLTSLMLVSSVLAFPVRTSASDGAADPLDPKAEKFARRVVELTNLERKKQNLPPLKMQADLAVAAHWMAQDMADHSLFGHTDHLGRGVNDRLPEFGYKSSSAMGENVAAGQGTPEEVVDGWMHSKGHRANILNPLYNEIGAGYFSVTFGHFTAYWAEDFGARDDVYPVVINNESPTTTSPDVNLFLYGDGVIEKMRFSNDAMQWSPWEKFSQEKTWTIAGGPGKHTVYVELSDGEKVYRSDDAITLASGDSKVTASAHP